MRAPTSNDVRRSHDPTAFNGTGRTPRDHKGFVRECPHCKLLRVIDTGMTTEKIARLVVESVERDQIAEVSALGFDPRKKGASS